MHSPGIKCGTSSTACWLLILCLYFMLMPVCWHQQQRGVMANNHHGGENDDREEPAPEPTYSPTNTPTSAPVEEEEAPGEGDDEVEEASPTVSPTNHPTNAPTDQPSTSPSEVPTNQPSTSPSQTPTVPTAAPTDVPTAIPSFPTSGPTEAPTDAPTSATPTEVPTTDAPTEVPTKEPTPIPTEYEPFCPSAEDYRNVACHASTCLYGWNKDTNQPTLSPTVGYEQWGTIYTNQVDGHTEIAPSGAFVTRTTTQIHSCVYEQLTSHQCVKDIVNTTHWPLTGVVKTTRDQCNRVTVHQGATLEVDGSTFKNNGVGNLDPIVVVETAIALTNLGSSTKSVALGQEEGGTSCSGGSRRRRRRLQQEQERGNNWMAHQYPKRGSAIYVAHMGSAYITSSTFEGNMAYIEGGAIYNAGYLSIENSYFAGNGIFSDCEEDFHSLYTGRGGALYNAATGVAIIKDTMFKSNGRRNNGMPGTHYGVLDAKYGVKYGGAIYTETGALTLTRCTFETNMAGTDGGAVLFSLFTGCVEKHPFTALDHMSWCDGFKSTASAPKAEDAVLTIIDSTFQNNIAWGQVGGAISISRGSEREYYDAGHVYVSESIFSANTAGGLGTAHAGGTGGGIGNTVGGVVVIEDSTFKHNVAYLSGGGVYMAKGNFTAVRSVFKENTAGKDTHAYGTGGGMSLEFYNLYHVKSILEVPETKGGAQFDVSTGTSLNSAMDGSDNYTGYEYQEGHSGWNNAPLLQSREEILLPPTSAPTATPTAAAASRRLAYMNYDGQFPWEIPHIKPDVGKLIIENCTFTANIATLSGGGLMTATNGLRPTFLTLIGSVFDGNAAKGSAGGGGGLSCVTETTTTLISAGAEIYAQELSIQTSTFTNNGAEGGIAPGGGYSNNA